MEDDYDEEVLCPICCEELDATDRAVHYCQCGFQPCLWCFHAILETAATDNLPGRCPNCRSEYDKGRVTMSTVDPGVAQEEQRRKKKEKPKPTGGPVRGKQQYAQIRVIQHNLVYAVGIPLNICREETLEQRQYFGQFGKIKKISVNRSPPPGQKSPTGSAYVTYVRDEDAARCINTIDGAMWEGKQVKATFGTTKYCNAFLKGVPCGNPDCLYLHEVADESVSFTKEDMLEGLAQQGYAVPGKTKEEEGSSSAAAAGSSMTAGTSQPRPIPARAGAAANGAIASPLVKRGIGAAGSVWGSVPGGSLQDSAAASPSIGGWAGRVAAAVPAPAPVTFLESDFPSLAALKQQQDEDRGGIGSTAAGDGESSGDARSGQTSAALSRASSVSGEMAAAEAVKHALAPVKGGGGTKAEKKAAAAAAAAAATAGGGGPATAAQVVAGGRVAKGKAAAGGITLAWKGKLVGAAEEEPAAASSSSTAAAPVENGDVHEPKAAANGAAATANGDASAAEKGKQSKQEKSKAKQAAATAAEPAPPTLTPRASTSTPAAAAAAASQGDLTAEAARTAATAVLKVPLPSRLAGAPEPSPTAAIAAAKAPPPGFGAVGRPIKGPPPGFDMPAAPLASAAAGSRPPPPGFEQPHLHRITSSSYVSQHSSISSVDDLTSAHSQNGTAAAPADANGLNHHVDAPVDFHLASSTQQQRTPIALAGAPFAAAASAPQPFGSETMPAAAPAMAASPIKRALLQDEPSFDANMFVENPSAAVDPFPNLVRLYNHIQHRVHVHIHHESRFAFARQQQQQQQASKPPDAMQPVHQQQQHQQQFGFLQGLAAAAGAPPAPAAPTPSIAPPPGFAPAAPKQNGIMPPPPQQQQQQQQQPVAAPGFGGSNPLGLALLQTLQRRGSTKQDAAPAATAQPQQQYMQQPMQMRPGNLAPTGPGAPPRPAQKGPPPGYAMPFAGFSSMPQPAAAGYGMSRQTGAYA